MFQGDWTTNYALNRDRSFSVFSDPRGLAKDAFWISHRYGSKRGSWHDFSGPTPQ